MSYPYNDKPYNEKNTSKLLGDLVVGRNADVKGDLTAEHNINMGDVLQSTTPIVDDTVFIKGSLDVNGLFTIDEPTGLVQVANDLIVYGKLIVPEIDYAGIVTVGDYITFNGYDGSITAATVTAGTGCFDHLCISQGASFSGPVIAAHQTGVFGTIIADQFIGPISTSTGIFDSVYVNNLYVSSGAFFNGDVTVTGTLNLYNDLVAPTSTGVFGTVIADTVIATQFIGPISTATGIFDSVYTNNLYVETGAFFQDGINVTGTINLFSGDLLAPTSTGLFGTVIADTALVTTGHFDSLSVDNLDVLNNAHFSGTTTFDSSTIFNQSSTFYATIDASTATGLFGTIDTSILNVTQVATFSGPVIAANQTGIFGTIIADNFVGPIASSSGIFDSVFTNNLYVQTGAFFQDGINVTGTINLFSGDLLAPTSTGLFGTVIADIASFTTGHFDSLSVDNLDVLLNAHFTGTTTFDSSTIFNQTSTFNSSLDASTVTGTFGTVIADKFIGEINATTGSIDNLTVKNLSVGTGVFDIIVAQTGVFDVVYANTGYFNTIVYNTETITTSDTTNLLVQNMTGTNVYITNLTGANAVIASLTGTNLSYLNATVETFTGAYAYIDSLTGTNITYVNATFTNLTGTTASFEVVNASSISVTGPAVFEQGASFSGALIAPSQTGVFGTVIADKVIASEFVGPISTSTGTFTTLNVDHLFVHQDATFTGTALFESQVTLTQGLSLTGTLVATESTGLFGTIQTDQLIAITGSVTTLSVDHLSVQQDATFTGTVLFNQGVSLTGTLYAPDSTGVFGTVIADNIQLNNNLSVQNLTVTDTITLGNEIVPLDPDTNDTLFINSNVDIADIATFNKTTGDVVFSSDVTIYGALNVDQVNYKGTVLVGDDITLNGTNGTITALEVHVSTGSVYIGDVQLSSKNNYDLYLSGGLNVAQHTGVFGTVIADKFVGPISVSSGAFDNLSVGTLTVSSGAAFNGPATFTTISSSTISASTGVFDTLYANTGFFNTIVYNTETITTSTTTNLVVQNMTGTNVYITNLTGANAVIANLTGTNLSYLNASVQTFTGTNAVIATLTGTTASFLNASVATFTGVNASINSLTGTNLTYTNASITNLTGTNLNFVTAVGSSLAVNTFTASTGLFTTLSTTQLFATGINALALSVTGPTTLTTLTASTGVFTNVTSDVVNASLLSVTGTASFSGTLIAASQTGLFGTVIADKVIASEFVGPISTSTGVFTTVTTDHLFVNQDATFTGAVLINQGLSLTGSLIALDSTGAFGTVIADTVIASSFVGPISTATGTITSLSVDHLYVQQDATFTGTALFEAQVTLAQGVSLTGTLYAPDSTGIFGTVVASEFIGSITSETGVFTSLTVDHLYVQQDATFTGTALFESQVALSQGVSVTGTLYAPDSTGVFGTVVADNIQLNNNLSVQNLTVVDTLTLGNEIVPLNPDVNDTLFINNSVNIADIATFDKVTGDVVFSSDVTIFGALNLDQVNYTGKVLVGEDITLNGTNGTITASEVYVSTGSVYIGDVQLSSKNNYDLYLSGGLNAAAHTGLFGTVVADKFVGPMSLSSGSFDNLSVGTLTVSSGASFAGPATFVKLTAATGIFDAVVANTGYFNSIVYNTETITTSTTTNLVVQNMTGTNVYITTLTGASAVIASLTGTSASFLNAKVATFTGANAVITSLTGTNLSYLNATVQTFTGSNAVITSLTGTTASFLNASVATFTGVNAYINSLTGSNLTYQNATVQTFTGTNASLLNASISTLTGTNAVITSLTGTTASFLNATIATLTGTNLFVSSIDSTQVVTSQLFATGINASALSVTGPTTLTTLTAATGVFVTVTADNIYASDLSITGPAVFLQGASFSGALYAPDQTGLFGSILATTVQSSFIGSITGATGSFDGLNVVTVNASSGVFTNLFAATAVIATGTFLNTTTFNATVDASGQTGIFGTLTADNLTFVDATVSNNLYVGNQILPLNSTVNDSVYVDGNVNVADVFTINKQNGLVTVANDMVVYGQLSLEQVDFAGTVLVGDYIVFDAPNGSITTSTLSTTNVACDLVPSYSGTYSLGSVAKPWKEVYVGTGSIYLGPTLNLSSLNGIDLNVNGAINSTGTSVFQSITGAKSITTKTLVTDELDVSNIVIPAYFNGTPATSYAIGSALRGQVYVPDTYSSVTVTGSKVFATSFINGIMASNTSEVVTAVIPSNGSFTIKTSGSSGNRLVNFMIVN